MKQKTDNHSPRAKLALRRHFLAKYHADTPPHVLDCFQGSGVLWMKLATEFKLASYWGVDVKPKKGRLQIRSERILEQRGWVADVVDLDAYGSPWRHWINLLRTFDGEALTVFLTVGNVMAGCGNYDREALAMIGARFPTVKLTNGLASKIGRHIVDYAMTPAEAVGLKPIEICEAFPQSKCRYIGVRLERRNQQKRRNLDKTALSKSRQP